MFDRDNQPKFFLRAKRTRVCFALCLSVAACATAPSAEQPTRYVYYLHGAIVEDLGVRGVNPRYGEYDYAGIMEALQKPGVQVRSEARPKGTDVSVYADKVVDQIKSQIEGGVSPSRITVIGASKGAVIASLVSTRLREPRIGYVLLANCNDWLIRTHNPQLTGRVLSIFEATDEIGQSCEKLRQQSPEISSFKEVRLETELGHGIVYRPLPQWIDPTREWIEGP